MDTETQPKRKRRRSRPVPESHRCRRRSSLEQIQRGNVNVGSREVGHHVMPLEPLTVASVLRPFDPTGEVELQ